HRSCGCLRTTTTPKKNWTLPQARSLVSCRIEAQPVRRHHDLFLRTARGIAVALISPGKRKRRQPGLATDSPKLVGRPQLIGRIEATGFDFDFIVGAPEHGRAATR